MTRLTRPHTRMHTMGMHAHAHTTCCGWRRQVSLAWILVHLYEEPELLAAARHELEGCSDLANYSQLQQMEVQDARLSYARGHYRRLEPCVRARVFAVRQLVH